MCETGSVAYESMAMCSPDGCMETRTEGGNGRAACMHVCNACMHVACIYLCTCLSNALVPFAAWWIGVVSPTIFCPSPMLHSNQGINHRKSPQWRPCPRIIWNKQERFVAQWNLVLQPSWGSKWSTDLQPTGHMWFRVSGISSRKWFEKNRPCTCQWHLVEAIRALDSPDLMVLRRDQSFLTLYWLGLVFLMFWGVEMLQNQLFGSSKISGVCSKDSPISMKVTPSLIPKFLPRLRFPSCQRR